MQLSLRHATSFRCAMQLFTPRQKAEGHFHELFPPSARPLTFPFFFSQYIVHFLIDHHDFWFVSCW